MNRVCKVSNVDEPHSYTDHRDRLREVGMWSLSNANGVYPLTCCLSNEEFQRFSFHKESSEAKSHSSSAAPPSPTTLPFLTFDSCCPNSSSFCCNGVLSSASVVISFRIFPISVDIPVPMTIPRALPDATLVPYKEEAWLPARRCGNQSGGVITS